MSRGKSIVREKSFYYHTLYWVLNVLFFTLVFWSMNDHTDFISKLHENAAFLPFGMIFTYFSVNYLIPRYFLRNRIALYVAFQVAVLLVYPFVANAVTAFYISPVIYHSHPSYNFYNRFLYIILILIFNIVPFAGIKILNQLREEALLRQKTENDKTQAELKLKEAELKLLKEQIHPHFLFNTLNNIYSLSLEKSDKTPDLILRLADMLNYIIYDCSTEKVLLTQEVDFIRGYLELQKVRYEDCDISFDISGELSNSKIAPMILHTFIDNSFKHGADKDPGSPWIKLSLKSENGLIRFLISNSIRADSGKDGKVTGIGINNTIKRLELLYPDHFELEISCTDDIYSVRLEIEV